jgi:hypothetical protein
MSNEAEIAEMMSRAEMLDNSGGVQTWRTFVDGKYLSAPEALMWPDGTYFLGFGAEEWQARECLHHQVRGASGWKKMGDHYEKE